MILYRNGIGKFSLVVGMGTVVAIVADPIKITNQTGQRIAFALVCTNPTSNYTKKVSGTDVQTGLLAANESRQLDNFPRNPDKWDRVIWIVAAPISFSGLANALLFGSSVALATMKAGVEAFEVGSSSEVIVKKSTKKNSNNTFAITTKGKYLGAAKSLANQGVASAREARADAAAQRRREDEEARLKKNKKQQKGIAKKYLKIQ